jgi:hypothetical protein
MQENCAVFKVYMFLKISISTLLVSVVSLQVFSQEFVIIGNPDSLKRSEHPQPIASDPELRDDEGELLKDIYHDFLEEYKENFRCSFLMLSNLAKAAAVIHQNDAFECLNSLFVYRAKELETKRKFFEKISHEVGSMAALRFLQQTEISELRMNEKDYTGMGMESEINVYAFASTTSVFPEQMPRRFMQLHLEYESDQQKLLEEHRAAMEILFTDVKTLAPDECNRRGKNYLDGMEKDIKLKEMYYRRIDRTWGRVYAARFLSFHEYNSMVGKLSRLGGSGDPAR